MYRQLRFIVSDGSASYGQVISTYGCRKYVHGRRRDRDSILAVANRDVRVARQNIAEMMLYVDDHAAHLANCASADDDSLTLMSAEILPRLEGGIRAALAETDIQ